MPMICPREWSLLPTSAETLPLIVFPQYYLKDVSFYFAIIAFGDVFEDSIHCSRTCMNRQKKDDGIAFF